MDDNIPDIRPAVLSFALMMEQKLRANDHKTEATLMPADCLIRRLQAEVLELEVATRYETDDDVQKEAADVANFALFIFARAAKMTIKRNG
jgi:NTP pyrophosphatase (non-canonical NTP hydrolase)